MYKRQIQDVLSCDAPLLKLAEATIVESGDEVKTLLNGGHPGLWLVVNAKEADGFKQLIGVLSPFELM